MRSAFIGVYPRFLLRIVIVLLSVIPARPAVGSPAEDRSARLTRGEVVVTRLDRGPGIVAGSAEGVIDAPVETVWQVLNQSARFCEYMPRYLVSDLIDPAAQSLVEDGRDWRRSDLESLLQPHRLANWPGDTVLFYNVLDMPFPVADRWYLLRMWRRPADWTIEWTLIVGNLKTSEGSWRLEAGSDGGRTRAVYTSISDPGIGLPEFVLDIGLRQTLPGVVLALRQRVVGARSGE